MLRLKIKNGASAIAPWANVADLTLMNATIKYIVGDGISGSAAFTPIFISPTRFVIRNTGAAAFAANDSAFVNIVIGM